jgi:hypothetical protein
LLLFSRAKVTVDRAGNVKVEGDLVPYAQRIARFVHEAGLRGVSFRHLFGRYRFSGGVDASMSQRLRNFLFAECPLKRS